jgi:hypothetical protein
MKDEHNTANVTYSESSRKFGAAQVTNYFVLWPQLTLEVLLQSLLGSLEDPGDPAFLKRDIFSYHSRYALGGEEYVRHTSSIKPSKDKVIILTGNRPTMRKSISRRSNY